MTTEEVFREFGNKLYRLSLVILKNCQDAEDAVQDTLIKYMLHANKVEGYEHIKAWLIRVNINICKNKLRFRRCHPSISLDQMRVYYETREESQIMEALMCLPEKYKMALLLHYVEGYKMKEIAGILGVTESTAKKRLERGRKKLRETMEGDGANG